MIGGRLDMDHSAPDALDKADLRAAYERGRADERARRKRHPVLMTITFLLALAGLLMLGLAAVNGSFTQAGGVVDRQLNVAARNAGPTIGAAASDAGRTLRDAGQTVRSRTADAG